MTPHIIGHTGEGKSSVVYQFAKEDGYDSVIEIRLGELSDMGDLLGLADFKLDDKGNKIATAFIPPSALAKLKTGRHILFLDEVNRASKDILQGVFQLVYDRRIGDFSLSDDIAIIAASNPTNGDYAVLDFADSAFQDRFVHMKFEATTHEFITYMQSKGADVDVTDFFQNNPEFLRSPNLKDFDLDFVQPSRRSAERLALLKKTGVPENLFNSLAVGIVGPKVAVAFNAYMNDANRIKLSAEELLTDSAGTIAKIDKILAKNPDRTDIFSRLNSELFEVVQKKEELTQVEEDALVAYFLKTPPDILFGFLRSEFIALFALSKTGDRDDMGFYDRSVKEVATYLEEYVNKIKATGTADEEAKKAQEVTKETKKKKK